MLRIVHYNCAGMDVHKKFIAVCIATTDFKGLTSYKKKRNPPVNTGFPSSMSSKHTSMSSSPILNMSGLLRARRPTIKMPCGSPTRSGQT